MSYNLYVSLTPQDRAQGTRGSAGACLLAVALQREYGGEWSVAGEITQSVGGDITWAGHTTVQGNAIIARFDTTKTAKTNRRVKVAVGAGKFRNRPPRRVEERGCVRVVPWTKPGKAAGAVAGGAALAGSAILTAEGDIWAVFAALGLVAAGLVASTVRNVRAGNRHLRERAETQKYVHVQRPATGQAQAKADEQMPAPAPAQPAPARLGSERLYTSPDPEPITDPEPAATPAPEPVPATAGGQAA